MKLKRDLLEYLNQWKNDPKRKPILLKGARQVGKSWLAKEIGKNFEKFIEINFEKRPELSSFFEGNIDARQISENIGNYLGIRITPGNSLLFLDEIQICPRAIQSLRYFYEDLPGLHVIAAGSLLEFELENLSVPVGRISIFYVYPLSFSEYLTALGKDDTRTRLKENPFEPLPAAIHNQLTREIGNYTLLGGLPEVISEYLDSRDFARCRDIQADLIETYRSDFHKYAKRHQVKYLHNVFDSIPLQLGNKFKYSQVSRDIKSRELSEALDLLEMAGLVYKVYHTSANGIPLKAESDLHKFKVLFFDIGLTQRLMKLDHRSFLLDPDITRVNNGAIAELLAGLEFIAYQEIREKAQIYYWHREAKSSNAEVDYVITIGNRVVPVEVKSSSTGSMKSLRLFMETKNRDFGVKVSTFNFSCFEKIQTIPFYAIESLLRENFNPRGPL